MNVYFLSNLIFVVLIIPIFVISLYLEGWTFKKISTKEISIVSILIALSVVLTNLVGYNFKISSINFSLSLGQWILFLIGIFFGPLLGFVSTICAEIIGDIINVGGVFHFGFLFSSCLCAFFGSLVYASRKQNLIVLKVIFYYSIFYILKTFIINPISYYCIGYYESVFVNIVVNIIKTPILLSLYLSLLISSYYTTKTLINNSFTSLIWFNRYA